MTSATPITLTPGGRIDAARPFVPVRIAVRFTAARMSTIKLLIEDYLAANEQYQLETSEDERTSV